MIFFLLKLIFILILFESLLSICKIELINLKEIIMYDNVVIIDNGSGYTKVGYSEDESIRF